MARGFFGGRKTPRSAEETVNWPQLPGTVERPHAEGVDVPALDLPALDLPALDLPALAYVMSSTTEAPAATPEAELLERIAAFRGSVADALFEVSKDYQILCNLAHADIKACDETIDELRRRLSGNVHYTVLAKLDEVYALVEAQVGAK